VYSHWCWRFAATAAVAQSKPPQSSAASSICPASTPTLPGRAARWRRRWRREDFGGEVLGRKIEIITADHLNKADLAANIARDMFGQSGR
jgi:branched-chain amino acid transport system substrate-binding protein